MYEDKVRFRAELQSPFSKMNVCVNINELASNRFRKISMQNTENKKDSTGEIQTDEMTEMSEKERRKQRFLFILYFVVIIAIAVFVIYLLCKALFPGLGKLFENGYDEEKVEQFLKHEAGWKGMFALCLLQFIQVISIFIAGAPIQIAGGMIYGFWISFLITHITFVFTNWLVFRIARRHSKQAMQLINMQSRKLKKVTEWLNSASPAYMCMLAYMMPGIPNGFVPYVAERTSITPKRFIQAVYFGSFAQIFAACFIGRRILEGDIFWSVAVIVIMILSIVILCKLKTPIIDFLHKHNWFE